MAPLIRPETQAQSQGGTKDTCCFLMPSVGQRVSYQSLDFSSLGPSVLLSCALGQLRIQIFPCPALFEAIFHLGYFNYAQVELRACRGSDSGHILVNLFSSRGTLVRMSAAWKVRGTVPTLLRI